MNSRILFAWGFWPIELVVAAVVIFYLLHVWRSKPGGAVARSLCHRDRLWFVLLVLVVPSMVWDYLFLGLRFGPGGHGPGWWFPVINLIVTVFDGVAFGLAACWIASPAKQGVGFNYGMTMLVAGALVLSTSFLFMVTRPFRFTWPLDVRMILGAVAVVAYLVSRVLVARRPRVGPDSAVGSETSPGELASRQHNPASTMLWLTVGLAPIPILLVFVSGNSGRAPDPALALVVVLVCGACNLGGGLGCLGRINNIGVRVVLGLFLGIFFFLLSWVIAAYEACSRSGGI
jgi:hypothetical protein